MFYFNCLFYLYKKTMRTIKLLAALILYLSFSGTSFSQGCYYGASATYTTNGGTVAFVNTSQMASTSFWDFGDGNTSTLHDPVHTYSAAGNYTVTLNITYSWNMGVYGSFSCANSVSGIVTILTLSALPNVLGCTDPLMYNYNPLANLDDGSCAPFTYGCTDPLASNYSSYYNTDDGSCIYCPTYTINEVTPGCPDYNQGVLEVIITSGTQIPNTTYNWYETLSYTQLPFTGSVAEQLGNTLYEVNINSNGCPTEYLYHQFDATWGCTDPLATNYNSTVTCDDGSCIYSTTCNEDAPTGLFINRIVQDRAHVNWDNMNSSLCTIDQYRIQYREVGATSWMQKTMGAPLGSCNYGNERTDKLLLNLTSNTTYEYQMKAWYCGGESSSWTGISTFTTLDACPNVGSLTVSTPTTTKATFDWDDSNGAYSFVRLKARPELANPQPSDWFSIGGLGVAYGTNTKDKNGLTPGESYRGQARTWCDPNGGPYRAATWSSLVYWTMPTSVRLEGGDVIANLDVYPNPSRDIFNISFTSETIQDLRVRVLNLVGEEIISEDLQQYIGEYTKQIDLNHHAKGIYLLEIETNEGVINKKMILQ